MNDYTYEDVLAQGERAKAILTHVPESIALDYLDEERGHAHAPDDLIENALDSYKAGHYDGHLCEVEELMFPNGEERTTDLYIAAVRELRAAEGELREQLDMQHGSHEEADADERMLDSRERERAAILRLYAVAAWGKGVQS